MLLGASFPKFGHPALAWISLAPLMVATTLEVRRAARPGAVFKLGLLSGVVYFGLTIYWVVDVMAAYGGLPSWVALLVGALLVAYLALYPALFAVLVGRGVRRAGLAGLWLAPLLWITTEWLRGWIGGGFAWAILGTSQATVLPVVQAASVVGVYGLSAMIALVSTAGAVFALTTRRSHQFGAAAVLIGLVVVVVAGMARVAEGRLLTDGTPLRVGLVQGNIEQDQKWDPVQRDVILQKYISLSRGVLAEGADLVIWPESSTPFFFEAESAAAAPVRQLAIESRTPFLLGTDELEQGPDGPRLYNSAVLIGSDGRTRGAYRKMQLVPFGEYVPLKKLLFFVGPLVEAVSDFTPGVEPVVFDVEGRRISVAICYEVVYPWITRASVARGAALLATITNDAWFGRSSAPYQHFEQAAVRAVETGRYLVRAANTGISGAVDPYGRALVRTPIFETAALTVDVRLLEARTLYSQVGDVVVWVSFAVTAWVAWPRRRRRPTQDSPIDNPIAR